MKRFKELTNKEACLIYLAYYFGSIENIKNSINNPNIPEQSQSIAKHFLEYSNKYECLDQLGHNLTNEQLLTIRNFLKGKTFGKYENGLIAGIFKYCLNI